MVAFLINFTCSDNDSRFKSIRIGKDSFATTISLNVGDTLIASLQSNPTTGYSWHLMKLDTGKIKLFESLYTQNKPAIPGNGGIESFRFITIDHTDGGTTELEMAYGQLGSMDTVPIDSFRVNLRIGCMMPD